MDGGQERRVVFVTGGARSGKSRFAQELVEGWPGRLLYLATAEAWDDEMRDRIAKHRADRGERWATLEEPLDLAGALAAAAGHGGILIDCLTLWTSNLLGVCDCEAALEKRVSAFLRVLDDFAGRVCVVTNEVGLGIVPENALARRFRDVAGRINQEVCRRATEAHFVVSGVALRLK